jgi:predicted aconitase with swiveling domain
LLESISNGTAPNAIIVSEVDPIIGLGAILGEELLGRIVPVVQVTAEERSSIMNGIPISIRLGGLIEIGDDSDTVVSESGMGKLEIQ